MMRPSLLRPTPPFSNSMWLPTGKRPPRTTARRQREEPSSIKACVANHPFGDRVPLGTPEPSPAALSVSVRMQTCAQENRNSRNTKCRAVS